MDVHVPSSWIFFCKETYLCFVLKLMIGDKHGEVPTTCGEPRCTYQTNMSESEKKFVGRYKSTKNGSNPDSGTKYPRLLDHDPLY